MTKLDLFCRTALPLLLLAPQAALGQDSAPPAPAAGERQIDFTADQLSYDQDADVVTASGEVRMRSEGNSLRADRIIWDRRTGEVRAEGNVRIVNPGGDAAYGETVQLTDTLRDGVVRNLLLVLEDGGRLAAERGERKDGYTTLYRAAYSPCAVVDSEGCPKNPTWTITAVEVVHDPVRNRINYKGASLNLLGARIIPLPGLSHSDGSGDGTTGLLVPQMSITRSNGFELSLPYFIKIAPNKDATVTPHFYTDVLPMLEGRYRQLTSLGAFQLGAFVTQGSRIHIDADRASSDPARDVRAYFEGNGKFQLNPDWSVTAAGRYVTDRTFLRRYDISNDDRLRSFVDAERITSDSYVSLAGWAFQGLRVTDRGGQQPIALPAIDARWRLPGPIWGGRLELQANSLSILRTEGQDTQRAFAGARWDRRSLTRWGQELLLIAFARGDVYHTEDTHLTPTLIYRGEEGWRARGIAALAAEMRWPLIGEFLAGTHRLTPRAQLVLSPPTPNLAIPNEDARSVDLEDSNLFALNRFPGHDRWEDGARFTYGFDWAVDLPRVAIQTTIGQSYRLNRQRSIFPEGTGLSERLSDVVGRTSVKLGRRLNLIHRFRLDKSNAAIRRNELDAVFGGRQTYATIGYLRLNRNIAIEDLRDREELRLGGRVRFADHWSLFGSTVVDLTSSREDPFTTADGYEPVRHRIGLAYDDECIEIGITWRRDYETTGDFQRGNSFLFRVGLKNLGR